jgi:anti-sigma factor RsiW
MRHEAARRHLPELLDGTLPDAVEQAVRAHAAGCARCSRHLAQLELCQRLVARLPLAVLPLAAAGASERRLVRLARWAGPEPRPQRNLGIESLAMAAAAAALAGVVALVGLRPWMPAPDPGPSGLTQVAYVMPAGFP